MATARTSSSAIDDASAILIARLREVDAEARQLRAALRALGAAYPTTGPDEHRSSGMALRTVGADRQRNELAHEQRSSREDTAHAGGQSLFDIRPLDPDKVVSGDLPTSAVTFGERNAEVPVTSGGHEISDNQHSAEEPRSAPTAKKPDRMSMRQRVLTVLQAHDRYMTPSDIADVITQMGHRDRKKSAAQFSASIRTALWQLRTSGDVLAGTNGQNIAMNWIVNDQHLDDAAGMRRDALKIDPGRAASVDDGPSGEEGE